MTLVHHTQFPVCKKKLGVWRNICFTLFVRRGLCYAHYKQHIHSQPTSIEAYMRRSFFFQAVMAGAAMASLSAGSATAYEFDPLTRQPLVQQSETFRAQSTAIPRETVNYDGRYAAGTIVISTKERRMYYVLPNGKAVKYAVGVGRPGFEWGGTKTVTLKREWPDWRPPAQMLKRRPDLPRHMAGGPDNPLGARAMYLGSTLYRIHGSNEPETIGQAVSSGCIRMLNDDVIDLYERARLGTRVVVLR
jgi:lipoprotein-anchoring transpeptidase ErfK/SrfK